MIKFPEVRNAVILTIGRSVDDRELNELCPGRELRHIPS
jgi:hypothetical protein